MLQTLLRTTLPLANHAGRETRIPDVCLRGAGYSTHYAFRSPSALICIFHPRHAGCETDFRAAKRPSQRYQNPIQNTYAPAPRPPQTQAAHFKRPYRN